VLFCRRSALIAAAVVPHPAALIELAYLRDAEVTARRWMLGAPRSRFTRPPTAALALARASRGLLRRRHG